MAKRGPAQAGGEATVSRDSLSPMPFTLEPGELWPKTPSGNQMQLEIIGGAGEIRSGKTLFGLSIAPGLFKDGPFAGKPRTRYYDLEKSGASYGGSLCDRVDVYKEFTKLIGNTNYKLIDVYHWVLSDIEKNVKQGQYDVIMIDPITDLEEAIVSYVRDNPTVFGYTANQFQTAKGLVWAAVKGYYNQTLMAKLASKCKTFYFTAHMRDEWVGSSTTGKREPKGKDTLEKLPSLYLIFERKPIKDGPNAGSMPKLPSAVIYKERISDTSISEDGELVVRSLLPPRLECATAAHIRGYIANGFDPDNIKPGERVIEEKMDAASMLRLEQATAEKKAEAENASLAVLSRRAQLLESMNKQPPKVVDPEAKAVESADAKRAANAIEDQKAEAAEKEKAALTVDPKVAEANSKVAATADKGKELMKSQPVESAPLVNKAAAATTATAPTAEPITSTAPAPDKATIEQMKEMQGLCTSLGIVGPKLVEMCQKVKKNNPKEFTKAEADLFLQVLKDKLAKKQAAAK